jgi:succinoglycan biosynthesis protein ExoM
MNMQARYGHQAAVDICICSYRRPEITHTLRAVARQVEMCNRHFRVIVAENTASAELREQIQDLGAALELDLTYVHAPADNISIARNACLNAAEAEWIAFLDDDELPSDAWLACQLREAEREGWDAVLGPVVAIYAPGTAPWLKNGDFHSTRPVIVSGRIETGYTGNLLLRRSLVEKLALRFSPALGKSGGEDTDFLYRLSDGGGRIGFASDAVVHEWVPQERATMRWLLKRSYRAGQSHGSRLRERDAVMVQIPLATLKAAICGMGFVMYAHDAVRRNKFLMRAALHLGVVAKLSGARDIRLY